MSLEEEKDDLEEVMRAVLKGVPLISGRMRDTLKGLRRRTASLGLSFRKITPAAVERMGPRKQR